MRMAPRIIATHSPPTPENHQNPPNRQEATKDKPPIKHRGRGVKSRHYSLKQPHDGHSRIAPRYRQRAYEQKLPKLTKNAGRKRADAPKAPRVNIRQPVRRRPKITKIHQNSRKERTINRRSSGRADWF